MQTTLGQYMVNAALPKEFRDYSRILTKVEADALLTELAKAHPEQYKDISKKLLDLGRNAAYSEGTTIRLSDTKSVIDKASVFKVMDIAEKKILRDKTLSPQDRTTALETLYSATQKIVTDQTYDAALAANNPFALQVKSKARGSKAQLTALLTTPSVYQDSQDRMIPIFIRNSYAEGLTPAEYWAATYGGRRGVISTKYSTREAGALGKQLGVASYETVVTQNDCETPYGIPVTAFDQDNIGAVLAQKVGGFPAGTVVNKGMIADLKDKKIDKMILRSPITCTLPKGVCKICTGQREDGKFPPIGYHLGLNASSALSERIAQSSLSQKHSGGQKDPKTGIVTYSGFPIVEQLASIPKTFPHRAAVAELDGVIEKLEAAPQGGYNVTVGGQEHYVGPELPLTVKVGDNMEAGDAISQGIVNPYDVVKYKGIGEGRRYFAERMTQAFRDSGYEVNRRNVEVLSRALVNHVLVDEPDGVGDHLPGDVVDYNSMAHSYRPRKDAQMGQPIKAIGQYLESPALHYTIGTRLTKNMAKQMADLGLDNIMTHPRSPGFVPEMVSVTKVPGHTEDWMARLGSTYLESRLLKDVHRAAVSQAHSLHPIPSMAKGIEFGEQQGKEFTY